MKEIEHCIVDAVFPRSTFYPSRVIRKRDDRADLTAYGVFHGRNGAIPRRRSRPQKRVIC